MGKHEPPNNEELNRGVSQPVKPVVSSPTPTGDDQSRDGRRSELSTLGDHKQISSAIPRRASGPRTAEGKGRSRYNAVKSGIFARVVLLIGESPAEYGSLLKGLREELQPRGKLETVLVENLAVLLWRKRRLLRAESAEIKNAAGFKTVDLVQRQLLETWDLSRAGETSGGMLRHSMNPFLIREALDILKTFRDLFEKSGFVKGEDPWRLRKLYGLDHDGQAPQGIFRTYLVYEKLATRAQVEKEKGHSPDELKKEMVEMFDEEIKRLEPLEVLQRALDEERGKYQALAALVPAQDVMERLIRYEAHLSREFDRTLNQLDRLQRVRLGQPVPPSVRLELSK